jgi:hypothetical protein
LIFYRLTFVQLSAHDFGPPYWINMGAVAITTLAGSILLLRMDQWQLLQEFRPFLKGFTVFFWSAATWCIPFLIALLSWRYLVRRDRLRYEPQLWGMVFPWACIRQEPFSFRAHSACRFWRRSRVCSYSWLWRRGSRPSPAFWRIWLVPFLRRERG